MDEELIHTFRKRLSKSVDLRASTGGTICQTIAVPANGTAGISWNVPYPQPFSDAAWTVDMADITGTTVNITATFSKEI